MQVRWNYKLQPNKGQSALASEWLVTLRKHRNYCLRERENGYESNNVETDTPVAYFRDAYCDFESRAEYGGYCPLTCAVVKHGVVPAPIIIDADLGPGWHPPLLAVRSELSVIQLLKNSKEKTVKDKKTGELKVIPAKVSWDSASGIQSKRTTQLRAENPYFGRVNADVLQGNLAKLDAAFTGFWQHKRGFPAYRVGATFNSFQYKPGDVIFTINRNGPRTKLGKRKRCYSHVYLPGLGKMRFLDSREIPESANIRTVTVKREADGFYISVLLDLDVELPAVEDREIKSSVGIDVGINKLVSLSDGSFIENPRFATNKKTRRLMRIRQRRVSRKVRGSKNRAKSGVLVAKLHKQIRDKREAHQWQAASKIVKTADAVVREDLNIKGMKARCKPKRNQSGRFMPNGQAAKRGLNRSISDAAWGGLFQKIDWLAKKAGKPSLACNAAYSSQECSACGHVSKDNRDGEKFVCEECGHIDHADTQASRTTNKRAGFIYPKNVRKDVKILPADRGEVTLASYDSAIIGKRNQGENCSSKALPEKQILVQHQLQLQLF
jgi:putative transposase